MTITLQPAGKRNQHHVLIACGATVMVACFLFPPSFGVSSPSLATTSPKQRESAETTASATTNKIAATSTTAPANADCPLEPCDLSLVMVGDSLTRFQYFSLVYFLRHDNTWLDPDSSPNLIHPKTYFQGGGEESAYEWTPWFRASTQALAPYEQCDCYREATATAVDWWNDVLPYICENRYYYDPVRRNRITYLQAYGNATTVHGHWSVPQVTRRQHDDDTVAPLLTQRTPYLWEGSWMDAIRGPIAALDPDVLLFNAGIWQHDFDDAIFRSEFLGALDDTRRRHRRVLWKTTTSGQYGDYDQHLDTDAIMCELLEGCLNVTWTTTVPASLYVDYYHFLEPVYRLLNTQLLAQLNVTVPNGDTTTSSQPLQWYPPKDFPIPGVRFEEEDR